MKDSIRLPPGVSVARAERRLQAALVSARTSVADGGGHARGQDEAGPREEGAARMEQVPEPLAVGSVHGEGEEGESASPSTAASGDVRTSAATMHKSDAAGSAAHEMETAEEQGAAVASPLHTVLRCVMTAEFHLLALRADQSERVARQQPDLDRSKNANRTVCLLLTRGQRRQASPLTTRPLADSPPPPRCPQASGALKPSALLFDTTRPPAPPPALPPLPPPDRHLPECWRLAPSPLSRPRPPCPSLCPFPSKE